MFCAPATKNNPDSQLSTNTAILGRKQKQKCEHLNDSVLNETSRLDNQSASV